MGCRTASSRKVARHVFVVVQLFAITDEDIHRTILVVAEEQGQGVGIRHDALECSVFIEGVIQDIQSIHAVEP